MKEVLNEKCHRSSDEKDNGRCNGLSCVVSNKAEGTSIISWNNSYYQPLRHRVTSDWGSPVTQQTCPFIPSVYLRLRRSGFLRASSVCPKVVSPGVMRHQLVLGSLFHLRQTNE